MKNVSNSPLKVLAPPGHEVTPTTAGKTQPAKIDEEVRHLADNPYALAAQGPLVVTAELGKSYDRPGLASMSSLGARIAVLTGGSLKPTGTRAILASVAEHPRRTGPIGGGVQSSVADLFPIIKDMKSARADVREALNNFTVERADATDRRSLLSKIEGAPISANAKGRIIDCLAEFKNSLDNHRDFDKGASEVNWKHICGEMGKVFDAGEAKGMFGQKLEDAALMSMFSDSVKFGGTLMRHNIDGAIAAYEVLSRRDDADMVPGRLAGIIAGTKEHQIGPPGLFAKLAADVFIPLTFSPPFNPDQMAATADARAEIRSKIADPMNADHVKVGEGGAAAIDFSIGAQTLLGTIDIDEWAVPHPDNEWFDASMAVIIGDSLINYASADGVGKIIMLSGPDNPPFEDPTVFHSMFSCGVSYLDAKQVISDDFAELYEAGAKQTQNVLDQVRDHLNAQLKTGFLAFPAAEFDDLVERDKVDIAELKIERHGDQVFVHVPGDGTDVPFVHKPLDYGTKDDNFQFAKLVRRNVGDLCRDYMKWMPEQKGAQS